jgi:hypothetical protein
LFSNDLRQHMNDQFCSLWCFQTKLDRFQIRVLDIVLWGCHAGAPDRPQTIWQVCLFHQLSSVSVWYWLVVYIIAVLVPGQSNCSFSGQFSSCMTLMHWTGWLIQHSRIYTLPNPYPVSPMLLPCVSTYELHSPCRRVHQSSTCVKQLTRMWTKPLQLQPEPEFRPPMSEVVQALIRLFRGPTWPRGCSMARRLLSIRMTKTRDSFN